MQSGECEHGWARRCFCSLQWEWKWRQRQWHRLLSRVSWRISIIWTFFRWGVRQLKIFIRFAFQIKFNSVFNKQIYRRLDMIGSIPSGNLFMSAAILFSGMPYSFISLHNCYNHKLIMNVLKMSALLFFYTDRPYTKESASFLGAYECCYYSIKYLPPTSEILSSSSCFNNVERFSE